MGASFFGLTDPLLRERVFYWAENGDGAWWRAQIGQGGRRGNPGAILQIQDKYAFVVFSALTLDPIAG